MKQVRSFNCTAAGQQGNHRPGRRQFAVAIAATGCPLPAVAAAPIESQSGLIVQPGQPGKAAFIARAFHMRKQAIDLGDQPYGAVVVREDKVIGQSWSRVILDSDPTAHAEMSALRDAARRGASLSGSVLYSSSRPCSMCEAAAAWCGIAQMIWGTNQTNAGAPRRC